jgi:hypothetical protein
MDKWRLLRSSKGNETSDTTKCGELNLLSEIKRESAQ